MKSLPWFRMYTETIDDEKLGLLAFEDRWHFVAILCLKGKGVLDSDPDMDMLHRKAAFKMGLTVLDLRDVAQRLFMAGLLDPLTLQPSMEHVYRNSADLRPSGTVWKRLREAIFARDDYTCVYCHNRGVALECDHVIPVSKGGASAPENLATACLPCNRSKRDKWPDEWSPS